MGGLDNRIKRLEERTTGEAVHGQSEPLKHLCAILREIGYLRQSGARGLRGGVPVVPQDIPRQILGPGYTRAQLVALAVDRAAEAGRIPSERAGDYLEFILRMGERRRRGD